MPGPVVNRPAATSDGLWLDGRRLLAQAHRLTEAAAADPGRPPAAVPTPSRATDGDRAAVVVAGGQAWSLLDDGAEVAGLDVSSVELAEQLDLTLALLSWIARAGRYILVDVNPEPSPRALGDRLGAVATALAGLLTR